MIGVDAMQKIVIGDMHFDNINDAMVACNCGHVVLCNQIEEIWVDGKVQEICDDCYYDDSYVER